MKRTIGSELLLVIVMEKRKEMVNTCCPIFACPKTTNVL